MKEKFIRLKNELEELSSKSQLTDEQKRELIQVLSVSLPENKLKNEILKVEENIIEKIHEHWGSVILSKTSKHDPGYEGEFELWDERKENWFELWKQFNHYKDEMLSQWMEVGYIYLVANLREDELEYKEIKIWEDWQFFVNEFVSIKYWSKIEMFKAYNLI